MSKLSFMTICLIHAWNSNRYPIALETYITNRNWTDGWYSLDWRENHFVVETGLPSTPQLFIEIPLYNWRDYDFSHYRKAIEKFKQQCADFSLSLISRGIGNANQNKKDYKQNQTPIGVLD